MVTSEKSCLLKESLNASRKPLLVSFLEPHSLEGVCGKKQRVIQDDVKRKNLGMVTSQTPSLLVESFNASWKNLMVSYLDSQLLEEARDQKQTGNIASFEDYTFVLYL